jgi:hypothetical protein
LEERKGFLEALSKEEMILFYEHDPVNEMGTVGINEKGAYFSDETFRLQDL